MQDSGYSDVDSTSENKNAASPQSSPEKTPSKQSAEDSTNGSDVDPTPPTVIRSKNVGATAQIKNIRRLTYGAPNSPVSSQKNLSMLSQMNEMSFDTVSPVKAPQETACTPKKGGIHFCTSSDDSTSWVYAPTPEKRTYNNETVIFGASDEVAQNTTPTIAQNLPLPTYLELFPTDCSTPKRSTPKLYRSMPHKSKRQTVSALKYAMKAPQFSPEATLYLSAIHVTEYTNPLLNGHSLSVQTWLDDTSKLCFNEVMSILQTKSIAIEAAKKSKISSITAIQMVRYVQEKVVHLQLEFEHADKVLRDFVKLNKNELCLESAINNLVGSIGAFLEKTISKNIYQAHNEHELEKFEDNIDNILDMAAELRARVLKKKLNYIQDDLLVLKRCLLIAINSIFDRLIKIIVTSIEDSRCPLILKSNLNYLTIVASLDFKGFASLVDAFFNNNAVKMLLLVCVQEKDTSTRALALRAMASVCSSTETISQLEHHEGIEILREILTDRSTFRSEPELREAVSVLTQITAPWHGSSHRISDLCGSVEALVHAITKLAQKTNCCQTLLLCAACLNNFSRIEATSIYSIIANESILCFRSTSHPQGPTVFLYEQVTSMIFNMSLNKRAHHHLAEKKIINVLVNIFDENFYAKYESRAENGAHRRTIKNLLHIFSRLINDSSLGQEILANSMIPIFSRIEDDFSRCLPSNKPASEFQQDVSFINKKLNDSVHHQRPRRSLDQAIDYSNLKCKLSFV